MRIGVSSSGTAYAPFHAPGSALTWIPSHWATPTLGFPGAAAGGAGTSARDAHPTSPAARQNALAERASEEERDRVMRHRVREDCAESRALQGADRRTA